MFGFLLLVSLLGAGAAVGEAEPTDSEAVAYSLDAVEIAVIEDLTPHSDIELSAEMVNAYMRPLRLSRGDRGALTRILVDELGQDGIFKPVVSKASDSLRAWRPGLRLTVYAVWFATALPPVIKMLADDQREPGPYGLRTRVEIVDAATGNLRYKALSHCLSEGPKKGAKMPLLKQTVLEKKHLEALATSAAQLRRGQQAGVE